MPRFKPLLAAVLVLSAAVVHAAPPSADNAQPHADSLVANHPDGKNLTERSLTALGEAAGKIGDVLSSGAQAFGSGMQQVSDQASVLIGYAKQSIGARYRWGGTSAETGFDCSGFVRTIVQQTVGRLLPHHAADQAAVTQRISKDELQPGDLVFFNTVRRRAYSHVGIYMGDGQFIHAPSRGERVRIDNLSASYWQKHFGGARRVLTDQPNYSLADAGATAHDGINIADAGSSASPNTVSDTPSTSAAGAAVQPAPGPAMAASKPDLAQPSASKRSSRPAAKHRHTRKQTPAQHGGKRGKPRN